MSDAPPRRRGAGGGREATPRSRRWAERLDDPDEPLYTVAIAADLLGLDPQVLRRLGDAVDHEGRRPSGNQRRYSRNDLELLSRAADLATEGHNGSAIGRILELERRVDDLTSTSPRPS